MNKSLNFFKDLFTKLLIAFKNNKKYIHKYSFIIVNFDYFTLTYVAKLVDALDLGPSNFCFESSSLSIRNFIDRIILKLKRK